MSNHVYKTIELTGSSPKGLEDAHSYAQLSRFLPESVQRLFDRRRPAVRQSEEAFVCGPFRRVPEVDSFLASLWD